MTLFGIDAELFGRGLDDPPVRLVRHEQIDVGRGQAVAIEQPARDLLGLAHRELEHRLPVLLDVVQTLIDRLVRRRLQAAARGHAERGAAAAVDLVLEVQNLRAARLGRRHHHRAGAVAEDDAGRAILVVDDARHHVRADHQHVLVRAARHELARRRQRIGERGTGRAQVETPGVVRADLVLDQAGGAREHHVRRHRPADDHADVGRRQPRVGDRLNRRLLAQVRRRHARIDDVPLADAGPLQDPVVGGVDHLLEIGVGQQPRRHVGGQRRDRRRPSADAWGLAAR